MNNRLLIKKITNVEGNAQIRSDSMMTHNLLTSWPYIYLNLYYLAGIDSAKILLQTFCLVGHTG
jgi:hypothetical protein